MPKKDTKRNERKKVAKEIFKFAELVERRSGWNTGGFLGELEWKWFEREARRERDKLDE